MLRTMHVDFTRVMPLQPGVEEHAVWTEVMAPHLRDLRPNVYGICVYGFTEMLNNAIDHSGADKALVGLLRTSDSVEMTVLDEGVGLFDKIRSAFGFADNHQALMELAKGKLTTDPARHTGEGIFFTARMFDEFHILSGGLFVSCKPDRSDSWLEERDTSGGRAGTMVKMQIDPASQRTAKAVFDQFAHDATTDTYDLARTRIGIHLAGPKGEPLVSRSQAKRVLTRLEEFREAVLDFEGVEDVGPAFVDELFRVFRQEHPEVLLLPVNANEVVMRAILRVLHQNGADTR